MKETSAPIHSSPPQTTKLASLTPSSPSPFASVIFFACEPLALPATCILGRTPRDAHAVRYFERREERREGMSISASAAIEVGVVLEEVEGEEGSWEEEDGGWARLDELLEDGNWSTRERRASRFCAGLLPFPCHQRSFLSPISELRTHLPSSLPFAPKTAFQNLPAPSA